MIGKYRVESDSMKHTQLSAYELVRKQDVSDLQSVGYLFRHKKTGARVLLLENDDENKVPLTMHRCRLHVLSVFLST